MIERLLFNRIDTESAGTAVCSKNYFIILAFANKTEPFFPFVKFTPARAEIALDSPTLELVPVAGGGDS